nr:hypothetical protein [Chlamydiota bacterium]
MSVNSITSAPLTSAHDNPLENPPPQDQNIIERLPEELLHKICGLLIQEERVPLSGTCRDFRRIAFDRTFLKIFAKSVGISLKQVKVSKIPDKVRNDLIYRIESTENFPKKEELTNQIRISESVHQLAQIVIYRDTFVVYSAIAKTAKIQPPFHATKLKMLGEWFTAKIQPPFHTTKLKMLEEWFEKNEKNFKAILTLDLKGNQLSALPVSFGQLSSLVELDLSANQLSALPDSIGKLSSLVGLDLSANQLSDLPVSFGQLSSLWYLDLKGNKLSTLPESFGQL